MWLQVARGYVALPRTRQRGTPAYEWTMVHRETRRKGIVQIKTGADLVDLKALADARADELTDTFAFAASGNYSGQVRLVTKSSQPRSCSRSLPVKATSCRCACGQCSS